MELAELKFSERGEISSDKKQVYIVDDDVSVCRGLKLLLTSYDFQVETFNSAGEFFKTVSNNDPGVLLLDIHMPEMNGWEMQQQLIRSGSKRPIIIVSGEKNGGLSDKALKTGAVGFVQKPFNDHDLVELINQAFTRRTG